MFSITSNSSSRELVFLDSQDDSFTIELRGSEVQAVRSVYVYSDGPSLASLFVKLSAYERPWAGAESWESLEQEFSLSASCSALGNVTLSIYMCGLLGGDEEWRLSFTLTTDLGQLPKIAANARQFFTRHGL